MSNLFTRTVGSQKQLPSREGSFKGISIYIYIYIYIYTYIGITKGARFVLSTFQTLNDRLLLVV